MIERGPTAHRYWYQIPVRSLIFMQVGADTSSSAAALLGNQKSGSSYGAEEEEQELLLPPPKCRPRMPQISRTTITYVGVCVLLAAQNSS